MLSELFSFITRMQISHITLEDGTKIAVSKDSEKINLPANTKQYKLNGTYLFRPYLSSYVVFKVRNNVYFPQKEFIFSNNGTWESESKIKPGDITIVLAKVTSEIKVLIDNYYRIGKAGKGWDGISADQLKNLQKVQQFELSIPK